MFTIDLNSDMGERPGALRDGSEELLMRHISSANIACGVHAGDAQTMRAVVRLAKKHGVGIGAHPSFPDRENFGRTEMNLTSDEIRRCVRDQVKALADIVREERTELVYVKPHGALYNVAVNDARVAEAIALGVAEVSKSLILLGLAGSQMFEIWKGLGFAVAGEAFADRAYESNGTLRSRKFPDALITDPERAAQQAVGIVKDGKIIAVDGSQLNVHAQTICMHSDTPGSEKIAAAVRRALEKARVKVTALGKIVSR